jgi:L-asparaginase
VITTGGTIEKSYDELDGTLENRTSIINKLIVDNLRMPYTEINYHPLLKKDSLHFTDEDRLLLLKFVKTLVTLGHPIVVLHGTDTMAESALYCYEGLKRLKIPVIFTGAMKPLGFLNTDAHQNVTEALFAAKVAKPGVYISFHGELYKVPHVRKNYELRTFEEIAP